VINVEYNQLDPLLRSQGDCLGDVSDPETGYSPFPGNANNLVIEMGAYAKTLRGEDQGVVLEFVNPKYKDATRTDFKKPTRLECMMQDIPKLFQKEMQSDAKIGFTMFDRWFTFSPAKVRMISRVACLRRFPSCFITQAFFYILIFRMRWRKVFRLLKEEVPHPGPCRRRSLTSTFRINASSKLQVSIF
jgi:hypothetical protein